MPFELTLDAPPAGYAMHNASGVQGTPALIAVREFTSSEDGELFLSRLEGFPAELIAKLPHEANVSPSMIDHMLVIIRRDLKATVYVNECEVQARVLLGRRVEKDAMIYEEDVIDIDSLMFGVEIPKDAAVLCIFSAEWRKGMFFDFTALNPDAPERDYKIEKLLGSYMAYLKSQQVFVLDDAAWSYLIESQWFPFVTLSKAVKKKVVAFAKERDNLDRLLPELLALVTKLVPRMLERWAESPLFKPHLELLKHAAGEFEEGDFISCTAVLYPRIEGLLRTLHESAGVAERASQRVLSATAVSARGSEYHRFSWLLPEMFRRYLEQAYFANFEPGKPAKLSRNSLGHGVASVEEFNEKGACVGFMILDQLFYFMPAATAAS